MFLDEGIFVAQVILKLKGLGYLNLVIVYVGDVLGPPRLEGNVILIGNLVMAIYCAMFFVKVCVFVENLSSHSFNDM